MDPFAVQLPPLLLLRDDSDDLLFDRTEVRLANSAPLPSLERLLQQRPQSVVAESPLDAKRTLPTPSASEEEDASFCDDEDDEEDDDDEDYDEECNSGGEKSDSDAAWLLVQFARGSRKHVAAPQAPSQLPPQLQHSTTATTTSAAAVTMQQPRPKRQRTSPRQLGVLEAVFVRNAMPGPDMRTQLARELGMSPRRVQIWFQNKRAKGLKRFPSPLLFSIFFFLPNKVRKALPTPSHPFPVVSST